MPDQELQTEPKSERKIAGHDVPVVIPAAAAPWVAMGTFVVFFIAAIFVGYSGSVDFLQGKANGDVKVTTVGVAELIVMAGLIWLAVRAFWGAMRAMRKINQPPAATEHEGGA